MTKGQHRKPKKVSVSIMRHFVRKNCFNVRWREMSGQTKNRRFNSEIDATKFADEVRKRLEHELATGDYESNVKRARMFRERVNQIINEDDSSPRSAKKVAMKEFEIAQSTATMGERVVDEIDDLEKSGNTEKAYELTVAANRSLVKAYEMMEKPSTARTVNAHISQAIYRLARLVDEKYEISGGDEYRDSCIRLLKEMSSKVDEWRAGK